MEFHVRPSSIWFSVAVVDNIFHKNSHHCYCPIGETLDSLCEGKIKITDIPLISVVKKGTEWLTVNNRRLWIFRQLERLGKCITIPVLAAEECTVTSECGAFMSATVRENPGGLWYLLPSCEMKDPFSHIIWDTVKHIKENMFPPPSRRIIITIFQNLSQAKLSQAGKAVNRGNCLNENPREDEYCSEERTFSSGYLDVRTGEFNVAQIDIIEKERRIEQWIVDQTVSREMLKDDPGIKAFVFEILPRTVSVPKYYHSVPGSLRFNVNDEMDRFSDISMVSVQGSLPFDTSERAEMLSAASCPTSGYLFVRGENGEIAQSVETCELHSEGSQAQCTGEDKGSNEQHLKGPETFAVSERRQANRQEIEREITRGIENILLQGLQGQTEISKQIPEIRSFIETCIERTFDICSQKFKMYESEIDALKSDKEGLLSTKNEEIENFRQRAKSYESEIENFRQRAKAAESNPQELQKSVPTFAQGPPYGVTDYNQTTEDFNISINDERERRILKESDLHCDMGLSLSELSCPIESGRRRTDSEQTVSEATICESDERKLSHQENRQDILDFELNNPKEIYGNFAVADEEPQENISPFVLGLL